MERIRYGEIVINSLQKALINQTPLNMQDMEALKTDNRYALYINQIPNILNECLYILSTRGKSITKNVEIKEQDANRNYKNDLFFDLKLIFDDYSSLLDVILNNTCNSNQFIVRDNDTLIIPKRIFTSNTVFVRYKAYPPKVDMTTKMMQYLNIPVEFGILSSLYVASELLKEQRPDLSVQFRNQFEAELGNLTEKYNTKNQVDVYGYL